MPPLWAKMRPSCSNGCVFSGFSPPVEAYRTCAMKVVDSSTRPSREGVVLVRGRRLLVDLGRPVFLEGADPVAIGVAPALLGERVGCIEQPALACAPAHRSIRKVGTSLSP
jgi:hypothetical protein